MNASNTASTKKPYASPVLVVKGEISELTQEQNKTFGATDGFLFQGIPIMNAS
jgi:hypothetical protein